MAQVEDGRRVAGRERRKPVGACWPYARRRRLDPLKRAAENAVTNAIRLGTLVPGPCETCGEMPTEAHHDDYSKPLSVRWRCPFHHRNVRARAVSSRRIANEAGKDDIIAIGELIRAEMDRQGLTQHQLAAMAGVSQPAVSGWFSGGFRSVGAIVAVCKALNFTLPYVFGEARERAQETPHVRNRDDNGFGGVELVRAGGGAGGGGDAERLRAEP